MPINSNGKGKRGEREACRALNLLFGINAHRGQQRKGGADSPDVLHDMPGIHFEVKRDENLSIYPAMAQAIRDSEGLAIPVVMHRRNRTPWLITCQQVNLSPLINGLRSKFDYPSAKFVQWVEFMRETKRLNLLQEVMALKQGYAGFFTVLTHRHPEREWLSTFILDDIRPR